MKKIYLKMFAALLVALCLSSMLIPVSAAQSTVPGIAPLNLGVTSISASCTGNGMGYVFVEGSCFTYSGYTVDLTLTLSRRYNGNDWTKVTSWKTSGNGRVSLEKTLSAYSGYEYQAVVSGTVYDSNGNFVESFSQRSYPYKY